MKAQYRRNEEHNGIEILFDSKPDENTRTALKANGFRWHKKNKFWYAKENSDRLELAMKLADGEEIEAAEPKEKVNEYGVKVGDIFHASWGYDQTNNNFFQVVALAGKKSVRVVEVIPELVSEDGICGISSDRTYKIDSNKMLTPVSSSVFIKDQDKGDLKRIDTTYGALRFRLASFTNAHLVSDGEHKYYESWGH